MADTQYMANFLYRARFMTCPKSSLLYYSVSYDQRQSLLSSCVSVQRSANGYPELAALMGPAVPDLRGMFLRGAGGNAAALGSVQGDAIRNITGQFSAKAHAFSIGFDAAGAFRAVASGQGAGGGSGWMEHGWAFDASRVAPTAEENRPVNVAVRYLMRAAM